MPTKTAQEMAVSIQVEEIQEQPHFTVVRKGKTNINLIVGEPEPELAKPVRRTKSKTTAKGKEKPLVDLTTHKGRANFNIVKANRCGFDVVTGFEYSVKVGGRGLNSKHFVIDAPAISRIMEQWQARGSWWQGSCEDIAASVAQHVLALAEENIDMILVTIVPNEETEIELMWQRGQRMPTNGIKRTKEPDWQNYPEEYFRGCGYAKVPY